MATKKSKPAKTAKASKAESKKLSALDAAEKVLSASKEPMNCVALIEAMEAKKLWTSPGGKTPASTLHAAISREIKVKGKESRFKKADRGQFKAA